ncbi:hypothetical protein P152DRAFT_482743 [Eremomyces bilateralis CBS 781.70]|uniref:Carotenoid oxygenase n=1 Tax=Eremomyces bilateralis CBS 781.70 TaxID=1392243 RepID=A0A6G1G152_9PEZI|nr:uncharacterized protein P152DRAFT_482743 [Eremomyces bilateralis CBS 781.70]KAF1811712.1 hypothetical protein P152DRAFT_482743 [Eremomyces bilateralis CBS 781.70]
MATETQPEKYEEWPNAKGAQPQFEQKDPIKLKVTGHIPSYAIGTLLRTGPGAHEIETEKGLFKLSHWFDGLSMVHKFKIENDSDQVKVSYSSRFIVDQLIETIRKTGSTEGFTFGQKQDPCQSYFKKLMSVFTAAPPSSTQGGREGSNIGVTISANMPGFGPFGPDQAETSKNHASGISTLVTKTDRNAYQHLNPETLEPAGVAIQTSLHPELIGQLSSAHAKSDPDTGDIFNYNLELSSDPTYRIFRVSATTGKTDILAKFKATPAYIHSLFLTQNYVVLCVWNSHLSARGASILWNKNVLDSISPLNPRYPAKWYIVDRKHGRGLVSVYDTPAFYAFHATNAWEEPSKTNPGQTDIIAEIPAFDSIDVLKRFYYENLISSEPGALKYAGKAGNIARPKYRRYRLPDIPQPALQNGHANGHTRSKSILPSSSSPKTLKGRVVFEVPFTASMELPTINPKYLARPHRYIYGICDRGISPSFVDGLVKLDTYAYTHPSAADAADAKPLYWSQYAHSPGEAIFIADPEGTAEDDGVLLSVVLDGIKGYSYLLVLDAKTMTEVGRAELGEGRCVGFGFHGTHVRPAGRTLDV